MPYYQNYGSPAYNPPSQSKGGCGALGQTSAKTELQRTGTRVRLWLYLGMTHGGLVPGWCVDSDPGCSREVECQGPATGHGGSEQADLGPAG